MTVKEFIDMAEYICKVPTLYVQGCLGDLLTEEKVKRYTTNKYLPFNQKEDRLKKITEAGNTVWGFDCVTLPKLIAWGWQGKTDVDYGGAKYQSNGVPDDSIETLSEKCHATTDFSTIVPGELLFSEDFSHCGIYIGNGMAIECTHRGSNPYQAADGWEDGVQHTEVYNLSNKTKHGRFWHSHGKAYWLTYEEKKPEKRYAVDFPYLRRGSRGEAVRVWQVLLINAGYNCGGTKADGIFGVNTEDATIAFQCDHQLKGDGIVGHDSMSVMWGV